MKICLNCRHDLLKVNFSNSFILNKLQGGVKCVRNELNMNQLFGENRLLVTSLLTNFVKIF